MGHLQEDWAVGKEVQDTEVQQLLASSGQERREKLMELFSQGGWGFSSRLGAAPSCPVDSARCSLSVFCWEGFRFKLNQPKKGALLFPWPLGICVKIVF